jgi:hypothetical protein
LEWRAQGKEKVAKPQVPNGPRSDHALQCLVSLSFATNGTHMPSCCPPALRSRELEEQASEEGERTVEDAGASTAEAEKAGDKEVDSEGVAFLGDCTPLKRSRLTDWTDRVDECDWQHRTDRGDDGGSDWTDRIDECDWQT